ncbi:MAG: hypothetical protein RL459_1121 [Pseudomonadota bacterium]|jgi:GNAT superfamily N-acetyltransferase
MKAEILTGQQYTGRFAVLDDLGLYGIDQAIALLRGEGALGLFAHTSQDVARFTDALHAQGCVPQAHVWDFYHADKAKLERAHQGHVPLPASDFADIAIQADWGASLTQSAQALMQTCGVAPASEQALRARAVPHLLALARHSKGDLLATGALTWGHCRQSLWSGYAQLGMVCVTSQARGQGLGRHVSAALIAQAILDGDTRGITAACAPDNRASAEMLRACGLRQDTTRLCVMFTLDGVRRTR